MIGCQTGSPARAERRSSIAAQRTITRLRARVRALEADLAQHASGSLLGPDGSDAYQMLAEHALEAVLIHREGRILYVNPAGWRLFGATSAAPLIGRSLLDLVPAEDRAVVRARMMEARTASAPLPLRVTRVINGHGQQHHLETTAFPITYAGAPAVQVVGRDLTGQRQAEAALTALEARYCHLVEQANDFIIMYDVAGRFLFVNQRFCSVMGYTADEALGMPVLTVVHPDDRARIAANIRHRLSGEPFPAEHEFRAVTRQGRVLDVHYSGALVRQGEQIIGVQAIVRDVTARKQAERALTHRAFHDWLTELPNRALLLDRLTAALTRAQAGSAPPAVLFLDLDDFKAVNDRFGHAAGDCLLRSVAERLRTNVRLGDTVARLGGDEFVVLVAETELPTAVGVAERLLADLGRPFMVKDQTVTITASVGIALAGLQADLSDLLHLADTALYAAKHDGGNRYVIAQADTSGP